MEEGGGGGGEAGSGSQRALAEALVLAERVASGKRLGTVLALDLLATVGVHALVATQIRELSVGLETDLALEGLDATVDVLMLFETARRREHLATLATAVLFLLFLLFSVGTAWKIRLKR